MRQYVFIAFLLAVASQALAVPFNVTQAGVASNSQYSVTDLLQVPDRAYPGDQASIRFLLGTTVQAGIPDAQLSVLLPFATDNDKYSLGNIAYGAKVPVAIDFIIPNNTNPGSYYIYVYGASGDGGQVQVARIPFVINEPLLSNALIARIGNAGGVYAGGSAEVPIEIENVGSRPADDVVVEMHFGSDSALTPIAADRVFIPSISPNSTSNAVFQIGASPLANPGFYPINVIVSYKVDKVLQPEVNQTFGLKVVSKTGLLVTEDHSSAGGANASSITITVANSGDTTIRSVYVSASSNDYDFSGPRDKFIGTLNLDDSATMSISATPKQGRTGNKITVTTSYKDYLNEEHVQSQDFAINGFQNNAAFGNAAGGQGLAGQRFGRRPQDFTIFGFTPYQIGGAIAAIVAAFFAYGWYARRKNKAAGGPKA